MKIFGFLSVFVFSVKQVWAQDEVYNLAPRADNRMVAYLGNWQNCPNPQQLEQYDVVVVAFAVTYTWAASKNICSTTCEIDNPPVCGNGGNPNLIANLHNQGKKVILSFGGAGMGGSWEGDVNDCWDYCYGRETQVVDRLVEIVNDNNFDGIDIDYEYFYTDNQNGRGFTKGAEAIKFLKEVTQGLRAKLPAGSTIAHAPMDVDLVKGTDYFNMLTEVAGDIDYLMPQYYNGVTRPNVDGFNQQNVGQIAAKDHYDDLVELFGGDATRVLFGFCIDDCSGTGSNANAEQAASVMREINDAYDCHGGAFFWVVDDDFSGQWSSVVNQAMEDNKGCAVTAAPSPSQPTTPQPTRQPVASPLEPCCPEGYTGLRPFDDCETYFNCVGGSVAGQPLTCGPGLLFDFEMQACNWANQVASCEIDNCAPTSSPTFAPTTAAPTPTPSANPTATPIPTSSPTMQPSVFPSPAPSSRPTWEPKRCCPPGYSGLRSWNDCTEYYACVFGQLSGVPVACTNGLLFDEGLQACNWANQVTDCKIDVCVPTAAPTQYPTSGPTVPPTKSPIGPEPTRAPQQTPVMVPFPTRMPAMVPVKIPEEFPTQMPVMTPEQSPEQPPVQPPVPIEPQEGDPTEAPTLPDVLSPFERPPTPLPTRAPVGKTNTPTGSPVEALRLTVSPTVSPTMAPQSPTSSPSSNTPEPTFKPTRAIFGGTTAPLPVATSSPVIFNFELTSGGANISSLLSIAVAAVLVLWV